MQNFIYKLPSGHETHYSDTKGANPSEIRIERATQEPSTSHTPRKI